MSEEQTEVVIPSSPADREALRNSISGLVTSLIRQQSETDFRKEEIAALSEKYDLPKKFIANMAKDAYKDKFDKEASEREQYESLFETIMKENGESENEE